MGISRRNSAAGRSFLPYHEGMPSIVSIATALPPHVVTQQEAMEVARSVYAGREDLLRLLKVFPNSGVERRHTAFPREYYGQGKGFEERNRDYVDQAAVLAEQAARDALDRSGLQPRPIH